MAGLILAALWKFTASPTITDKGLTTAQKIKLIQDSWKSAEPVYGKIIVYFYEQLFEADASIRPLFKNVKMADQSMKVIEAITASVKGLDDVPAVLDILRELGKRHIKYNVTIAHYVAFEVAFTKTLKHFFGVSFQGDLQESWTWLISVICSTMTEPYPKPITTAQKIKLIQDSWKSAEPVYGKIIIFFYDQLFAEDSTIKPLFKNVKMADQSMKVIEAITASVKGLDDVPAVLDSLRELGKRHIKYGVTIAHYGAFDRAFSNTLKHFFGDKFQGDLQEAWTWLISVICSTMTEPYPKPLTTLQKIKIVQDTWAAAEPAYPLIIDYFYEKMFAYDASIEPLFKNVAMKDQKMGVVNAVTGAIKGLNDVPAVLDGLRELGKRHLKYRVTSAHYDAFSSAFLETLAHFMAENYKGDVKESWVWIIGVICATMREAYNK